MSLFLVILSVLNICFVGINSLGTYNYDDADMGKGPSGWPVECKTTLQSPINIIEDDVQRIPYPAVLNIEKYSASPDFETAKKEEFNLEFRFKYPGDKQSILSGGPLGTDIYLFEKLNFHWGDNCFGSEHALNNKGYAAEVHLIHYNSKYGQFDKALGQANGLAIISVLIELVIDDEKTANSNEKIVKLLKKIREKDIKDSVYVIEATDYIRINDILPNKYFNYYAYRGGLTSPPCQTGVTWIVAKDTMKFQKKDLAELKSITNSGKQPIPKNNRPVQKLNDRTVYLFENS